LVGNNAALFAETGAALLVDALTVAILARFPFF
jgi:hypothetical protein